MHGDSPTIACLCVLHALIESIQNMRIMMQELDRRREREELGRGPQQQQEEMAVMTQHMTAAMQEAEGQLSALLGQLGQAEAALQAAGERITALQVGQADALLDV